MQMPNDLLMNFKVSMLTQIRYIIGVRQSDYAIDTWQISFIIYNYSSGFILYQTKNE